jgi:hypothetical protein
MNLGLLASAGFPSAHHLRQIGMTILLAVTPAAAFAQSPIPITQLSVLWEVNTGGGTIDYTSTTSSVERDQFPFFGANAYVQADTMAYPLYRLFNEAVDHMDSNGAGEADYATQETLGSPWSSPTAVPGLSAITRIVNRTTGDHAMAVGNTFSDHIGYSIGSNLSGIYGYARYGNLSYSMVHYSGGGIFESSDSVAGGAVASWTWNGVQFLNTDDYGRYMQADVFYTVGDVTYNPIEAGDHISGTVYGQTNAKGKWHGSPVLNNQITNGVHLTRSIPLDYGLSPGGVSVTPDHPSIYSGMEIGKNLTLNFAGLGPVGHYQTVVNSPVALASAVVEIPSAYLESNFNSFYTYDAASDALTQVAVPDACPSGQSYSYSPPSGYGGVIISDATGQHALGVYGVSAAQGGSIGTPYGFWNYAACAATNKWNAVYQGPLNVGENDFSSYVISGTPASVAAIMQTLYAAGYK